MEIRQQEEFIILDDVLPINISETYKEIVMGLYEYNMGNTYYGTSGIPNSFWEEKNIKNIYEQFQFSHLGVDKLNGEEEILNLKFHHISTLPLTLACLDLGWGYREEDLFRCKINIQTKAPKEFEECYNEPHTDLTVEKLDQHKDMMTSIYYINDSDGDTFFFNESNKAAPNKDHLKNLTIKRKITPKQGRMVIFPSYILHAGMHPIESNFRAVINYNFKAMDVKNFFSSYIPPYK
jgi:hypothetical protein